MGRRPSKSRKVQRENVQGFAKPYKEKTKVSKAERLREQSQKESMVKAEDMLEKMKKGMLQ